MEVNREEDCEAHVHQILSSNRCSIRADRIDKANIRVGEVIQNSTHYIPDFLMATSFFLRLICLGALIYCHDQAASLPTVNEDQPIHWSNKHAFSTKLRSFNPLFIFQQSIRKPKFESTKPTISNIPRRWVRRGSGIDRNIPMMIWNHQLLPKLNNERKRFNTYYNIRKRQNIAKQSNELWQYQSTSPLSSPFQQYVYDSDDWYASEPEMFEFLPPEFGEAGRKIPIDS